MKASIDEFESKLSSCRAKGTEGETREDTDSPAPVVPAKRTKQSRSSKPSIWYGKIIVYRLLNWSLPGQSTESKESPAARPVRKSSRRKRIIEDDEDDEDDCDGDFNDDDLS